jgi:hypothetical protein
MLWKRWIVYCTLMVLLSTLAGYVARQDEQQALAGKTPVPTPSMPKAMPTKTPNASLPPAVAKVVLDAAAQRSQRSQSSLKIVQSERRTWPNSCLGLAQSDEFCGQALIPGWRVTVGSGQAIWVYRTDDAGKVLRFDAAASQPKSP